MPLLIREYTVEKYAIVLRLKAARDMARRLRGRGEAYYRDVLRRWIARHLERTYPLAVTAGEAHAQEMTDYTTLQRVVRAWVFVVRNVRPGDVETVRQWLTNGPRSTVLRLHSLVLDEQPDVDETI